MLEFTVVDRPWVKLCMVALLEVNGHFSKRMVVCFLKKNGPFKFYKRSCL